jgi:2-polyprenyl-3-methyl-5-hydroxy-6-metoxy-1,4-benzoquinol methylase
MNELFDSARYLECNPDVAEAVAKGTMRSAWSHFVDFGYREGRPGVPEAVNRVVRDVMETRPTPPPEKLILRVNGSSDAASFEGVGRRVALDIYAAVSPRLPLQSELSILDFGCGCGRVLPFMRAIAPRSTIHGTDIDAEAIAWCRDNYSADGRDARFAFETNDARPPTRFASGKFDLVYGISVFTHLPRELEDLWLGELRRMTKPGGYLVLSIQNETLIRPHLSVEGRLTLDSDGIYHFPYGGTEGLPDFYQSTWHTHSYVDAVWSRYFTIAEKVAAGISNHQDLILCRRPVTGAA